MKTILGSRRHHYVARVSTFLIVVALIAGMVGCGGGVEYDLTMAVSPPGSGTTTPTGRTSYAAGTSVNIQAVAAEGYQFVNWTAPAGTFGSATAATTTFTMPAQDVTVTANFAWEIWDWYDLDAVRNNLGGSSISMNDLDSTTAGYTELASPTANQGKGWRPIGTWQSQFTGSFDGQGYEIRDLFINRPYENHVGLFGVVSATGVVQKIGVVNATVTGDGYVGGLVGYNYYGTVSSSYSTGCVSGGNSSGVGGLVGSNGGPVSNSYFTGNVTGHWSVGGLLGSNGGPVSNSYSTGNVTGDEHVGGLMGQNAGTVTNSYSSSNTIGTNWVGGLVGWNFAAGTVSNSYSTGSVTGSSWVGGLMGSNWGTVSKCYSSGSVTGNSQVGGLVGGNVGTVSNSFWDTVTSGQATSQGGTGKTTAQMQVITTFSGATWDIIEVANPATRNHAHTWNIVKGVTYPFLSWEP